MSKNNIYLNKNEVDFLVKKWGTPLVVYDEEVIKSRFLLVKKSYSKYRNFSLLYAVKANSNVSILKIFNKLKSKIDASSPGDVHLALKAGFKAKDICATGPNWTNDDLKYFIKNKIFVDLDSISQIIRYGEMNYGAQIGIRINPGIEFGFHKDVSASGQNSKLGISLERIKEAKQEAQKKCLEIIGLHFHIASSAFNEKPFIESLKIVLKIAKNFENIQYINIGGGMGVAFSKKEKDFNVKKYARKVIKLVDEFNKENQKELELRVESGEFLMWSSACAISQVNTVKINQHKKFIGIDINSSHIPTPYLYDTFHQINTFSKKVKERIDVVGNLCQAGDILAKNRFINELAEGDYIIIQNCGAYCLSRASHFNSRLLPKEVLKTDGKKFYLIRNETLSDLLKGQIYE